MLWESNPGELTLQANDLALHLNLSAYFDFIDEGSLPPGQTQSPATEAALL